MGIRGALDYLSDQMHDWRPKKMKIMKTVALKVVSMCCEGCERNVKASLSYMKGVKTVDVDLKMQKVTVTGYMEPHKVLKRVQRRTKKKVEFWPYVPYNMVPHPYIAQAYDKKAPTGHVRAVDMATATIPESIVDLNLTNTFSDENPHACSIM